MSSKSLPSLNQIPHIFPRLVPSLTHRLGAAQVLFARFNFLPESLGWGAQTELADFFVLLDPFARALNQSLNPKAQWCI